MTNLLKTEFYDKFSCIADQCSFTCCQGWEIIVDTDTYSKWKSNEKQSAYFLNNVKMKEVSSGTESYIKMGHHMCCPFLDEKGLCNIVIKCGEDYLAKTCKTFPRQENSFGNLKEDSLSCACPAVVDIIDSIDGKMKFVFEGEKSIWDNIPSEYRIREAMITIMQNSKFSLRERILLVFHMLLFMKKESVITKEMISKYEDEKYLLSLVDIWSRTELDCEASCREINELFLDIVQNYKKEKSYIYYLKDISDLAEDLDVKISATHWNDFKTAFGQYDKLMENVIVSKIFSNCINDDIDDMIISYQVVIAEYTMVKYSTFLLWLINEIGCKESQLINEVVCKNSHHICDKKEIDYSDIRDYIVVYSRIIGYNSEGIKEFWEDSFDEAVWEFGYMFALTN